jgi:hypothetical protein
MKQKLILRVNTRTEPFAKIYGAGLSITKPVPPAVYIHPYIDILPEPQLVRVLLRSVAVIEFLFEYTDCACMCAVIRVPVVLLAVLNGTVRRSHGPLSDDAVWIQLPHGPHAHGQAGAAAARWLAPSLAAKACNVTLEDTSAPKAAPREEAVSMAAAVGCCWVPLGVVPFVQCFGGVCDPPPSPMWKIACVFVLGSYA